MKHRIGIFLGVWGLSTGLLCHAAPLIVDHTCVDLYTNLTAGDLARVKTMWVDILGASHASGYRVGCQILQSNVDNRFTVNVTTSGEPEGSTTNHLRISSAVRNQYSSWSYSVGAESWFTAASSVDVIKTHVNYCASNSYPISALGFGWSWQPTWINAPGGGVDPNYNVRWAGASEGGPDGNIRWGLTDDSYALTGNRVSMDTYLRATQEYIDYCRTNGYPTRVFFTTGPPDGDGGNGEISWQRHLKYEHIRNYVNGTTNAILLDYADILSWNDAGQQATGTWTDLGGIPRTYSGMHYDNLLNLDGSFGGARSSHIGERGEVRLAKALWYMLAKIAEENVRPPAPVLHVASDAPGVVQIQFSATSNATYTVQFTTNLLANAWQDLVTYPSQPDPRTISFVDHPATNGPPGFYRVSAQAAP